MNKLISMLIVTLTFAGWAGGATAQTFSNGYLCDSKNPGGEATRRYYRETDGQAINISPTDTFPVVCPIQRAYGLGSYTAIIRLTNAGSVSRNIACALEEYDRGSNLVRTIGKSKVFPPGISNDLSWDNYTLSNEVNYTVIRCILPPRSYVGLFAWD